MRQVCPNCNPMKQVGDGIVVPCMQVLDELGWNNTLTWRFIALKGPLGCKLVRKVGALGLDWI